MVKSFGCYKYNRKWLLVEMLIDANVFEVKPGKFAVPDEKLNERDWQVPYMAQWLNEKGTKRICDVYSRPKVNSHPCRIAFFIYREDSKILRTPYGEFDLTNPQRLPWRLRFAVRFSKLD